MGNTRKGSSLEFAILIHSTKSATRLRRCSRNREQLRSRYSQAFLHQRSARVERHAKRIRPPATGGRLCVDDPEHERARRIRPRRRRTGVKCVGNTGLLIDLLLFVELVAEPVARPLQAQRQAGRPVENGSAGETARAPSAPPRPRAWWR